jgi:hypothetical protein
MALRTTSFLLGFVSDVDGVANVGTLAVGSCEGAQSQDTTRVRKGRL